MSFTVQKTQLQGLKIFTATSTTQGLTNLEDCKIFLAKSLVDAITTNLWKIETHESGPDAHLALYSSNFGSKDSKKWTDDGPELKLWTCDGTFLDLICNLVPNQKNTD